jgi:hypothetical protein
MSDHIESQISNPVIDLKKASKSHHSTTKSKLTLNGFEKRWDITCYGHQRLT